MENSIKLFFEHFPQHDMKCCSRKREMNCIFVQALAAQNYGWGWTEQGWNWVRLRLDLGCTIKERRKAGLNRDYI